MQILAPTNIDELREVISDARSRGGLLTIRGGGSKSQAGAPCEQGAILDMSAFRGGVDYDPAEMVMTAGAATPLVEIESLIDQHGQMLGFEPFDHGPFFGADAGKATIGGVFAAGICGSRRLVSGAARDHLLGFDAVSGRGDFFVGGGKVVKNVTGYDLPKLMANSWGRLAALTRVTFKVLPKPRAQITQIFEGLSVGQALHAMAKAMGSHCDVSSAAFLPLEKGTSVTALRLEGFRQSVEARMGMLTTLLGEHGAGHALEGGEEREFWLRVRDAAPLGRESTIWRAIVAPSLTERFLDEIGRLGASWILDWAGGLVWLSHDGDPALLRNAAAKAKGHAALWRASVDVRAATPMFQRGSPGVMRLEERVRRAFDPAGIFETGRFLDKNHAD